MPKYLEEVFTCKNLACNNGKKKKSVITVIFKEECKFKLQALVIHSVDYFQLSDESLLKTVE